MGSKMKKKKSKKNPSLRELERQREEEPDLYEGLVEVKKFYRKMEDMRLNKPNVYHALLAADVSDDSSSSSSAAESSGAEGEPNPESSSAAQCAS